MLRGALRPENMLHDFKTEERYLAWKTRRDNMRVRCLRRVLERAVPPHRITMLLVQEKLETFEDEDAVAEDLRAAVRRLVEQNAPDDAYMASGEISSLILRLTMLQIVYLVDEPDEPVSSRSAKRSRPSSGVQSQRCQSIVTYKDAYSDIVIF